MHLTFPNCIHKLDQQWVVNTTGKGSRVTFNHSLRWFSFHCLLHSATTRIPLTFLSWFGHSKYLPFLCSVKPASVEEQARELGRGKGPSDNTRTPC
jgi:hypothetical protein